MKVQLRILIQAVNFYCRYTEFWNISSYKEHQHQFFLPFINFPAFPQAPTVMFNQPLVASSFNVCFQEFYYGYREKKKLKQEKDSSTECRFACWLCLRIFQKPWGK